MADGLQIYYRKFSDTEMKIRACTWWYWGDNTPPALELFPVKVYRTSIRYWGYDWHWKSSSTYLQAVPAVLWLCLVTTTKSRKEGRSSVCIIPTIPGKMAREPWETMSTCDYVKMAKKNTPCCGSNENKFTSLFDSWQESQTCMKTLTNDWQRMIFGHYGNTCHQCSLTISGGSETKR